MDKTIYKKLEKSKIIPVIAIENSSDALPLADALLEGGVSVIEITFRTDAAAEVISLLNEKRPDMIVGAGTILSIEQLRAAKRCGAAFGVSPGLNPGVLKEAAKLDFPFSPGITTPTDIEKALSYNIKTLKFFPAEAAGGVDMLKAISGPYSHKGIRFIPTGGINQFNMKDYLNMKEVLAVGGSWLARQNVISMGRWSEITNNCKESLSQLS
jgi:2-dehydro-3-deoxyphosphogluconate aldolase/(4S)-4-hydroxy-2-oxoglutarate aldolase